MHLFELFVSLVSRVQGLKRELSKVIEVIEETLVSCCWFSNNSISVFSR